MDLIGKLPPPPYIYFVLGSATAEDDTAVRHVPVNGPLLPFGGSS